MRALVRSLPHALIILFLSFVCFCFICFLWFMFVVCFVLPLVHSFWSYSGDNGFQLPCLYFRFICRYSIFLPILDVVFYRDWIIALVDDLTSLLMGMSVFSVHTSLFYLPLCLLSSFLRVSRLRTGGSFTECWDSTS